MYFERLDGLRAVAVALVIASHFLPTSMLNGIEWGIYGVTLFFVLSGFLITGILYENRGGSLKIVLWSFYVRRFLRIFPLYYLCLLLVMMFSSVGLGLDALWHVFYASNWFFWLEGEWVTGHPVHFWSLAVEEQFYLIWPIVFLFFNGSRPLRIPLMLLALGLGFRFIMLGMGWTSHAWTKLTPSCFEALGFGALMAVMLRTGSQIKSNLTLGLSLGAFALIHTFSAESEWQYELRYQSAVCLSAAVVWILASSRAVLLDSFFLNRHVKFIGTISYGLYIWHLFMDAPWQTIQPYWIQLCHLCGFPGWIEFSLGGLIIKLTLTFGVSILTWYGFEKPLLRLKSRFRYDGEVG